MYTYRYIYSDIDHLFSNLNDYDRKLPNIKELIVLLDKSSRCDEVIKRLKTL